MYSSYFKSFNHTCYAGNTTPYNTGQFYPLWGMSHDDILNAKIQKNLLKKDWNVPRDYHVRKIMKEILDIIMQQYSDLDAGISHNQLAESIRMNRKAIRPYLKRLTEMGLVTRDQGKHGKYFPTTRCSLETYF